MEVEFTPAGPIFSESFEVAETSCWLQKSKLCIIISLADNISVVETTELLQMLLTWVQFTESTYSYWLKILVKVHLMDGVLFLFDVDQLNKKV